MSSPLDAILRPRRVAIVGASSDPSKRGHQAVRGLLEAGFRGDIHPVHPDGGRVLGISVARSLDALPAAPDLALLCTRPATIPDLIERCGRLGIRGAVVLAVGFRESGPEGAALETRITEAARRRGVRIVGPNTSGILNPAIGLNLVGIAGVAAGGLAVLSQSGNIGLDLMTAARRQGLGLSLYVGVGNESDVRLHEYLEYVESDGVTEAVMIYAEGFRDGTAFLSAAERVNERKPVVVLKGGRTEGGRTAARSHTGAVAGSYVVLRSLLEERGIAVAERSDELLGLAQTLRGGRRVEAGTGIAVLADGGGHATLATDVLHELGVRLAEVSEAGRGQLGNLLGRATVTANPIDLAGAADRDPAIFARAARVLMTERDVGGVLVTGLFGGYGTRFDSSLETAEDEAAASLAAGATASGKPLILHTLYADAASHALGRLREADIPVLGSLEIACRCAAVLNGGPASAGSGRRTLRVSGDRSPDPDVRSALPEPRARALVARFGVPVVEGVHCPDREAVREAAAGMDGPLVMRIVSPGILHKTEAGGVALGLLGPDAVVRAYGEMEQAAGGERMSGVLLSPELPRPVAEVLIAARRDPEFGPLLIVGQGGVDVEAAADVRIHGLPLRGDRGGLFAGLRIESVLRGSRGRPAADLDALAAVAEAVAGCLLSDPHLETVELNPVFAYPERAVAVDVLVVRGDIAGNPTARG
ncbi:MAG: acetate--CoA ligase family protein [Gemmatimonadota bacterium]